MEKDKLALEIYKVAMEIKKEIYPRELIINDDLSKEERVKNLVELFWYQDMAEKSICGYLGKNKKDSLAIINIALSDVGTAYHLLYRVDASYEATDELDKVDTLHHLVDGLMTKKNFKEMLERVNEQVLEEIDYVKVDKLYNKIRNLEKKVTNYCETLQIMKNDNLLNKEQIGVYIRYDDDPQELKRKKEIIDDIIKQNFSDKDYCIKYYIDKNVSGLNDDREEFNSMINDIKNHNLNYVVCPTLSNISRDHIYLNNLFFPLLSEKNIDLYTRLGKYEKNEKIEILYKDSDINFNDYEDDDYEDEGYEF